MYKDTSYDAWGNVTGRTYNGTSETLAYDELDHMVKASLGGPNDYFAYDASGNRTVQRATSGGTTTLTVYAFGLEEYQYSGTGTLQNATYYYSLGGRLVGELTGLTTLTTNVILTDALGSVMAAFSNAVGAATLSDNQVYGPYGNLLYSAGGTMGTARGYTGQYSDPLTGLDYYVSRYYDPVAGVFLSADTKEGNAQGMNPYAYVAQNPETLTDPSGQMVECHDCGGGGGGNQGGGSGSGGIGDPGAGGHQGGGGMKDPGAGGNTQPKTPKLMTYGETMMSVCDATCQQEEQAYQIAAAARDYFYSLSGRLSFPGLLGVGLSAVFYDILKLFGTAFVAGIMGALVELSYMANDVANEFKQETDQVDLRKGQGIGYFNFDNVLHAGDQITGNIRNAGLENWLGGWGVAIASFLVAVFAPDPEPISKGTIFTIFTGIAIGAFTYGTIVGMGALMLYDQAQSYIDQETSYAPCTDSAGCNYPLNYP